MPPSELTPSGAYLTTLAIQISSHQETRENRLEEEEEESRLGEEDSWDDPSSSSQESWLRRRMKRCS